MNKNGQLSLGMNRHPDHSDLCAPSASPTPLPASQSETTDADTRQEQRPAIQRSDTCYRIRWWKTWLRAWLSWLPPFHREAWAEKFLRRRNAPGPAAEHVLQYLLSTSKSHHGSHKRREATIAIGADQFYAKQYRQFFNAHMGAFAMTATQAFLAGGAAPTGRGWKRHRPTYASVVERVGEADPILVLNNQAVAIPLYLPELKRAGEWVAAQQWLAGRGAMPAYYRSLIEGDPVHCVHSEVDARSRSIDGAQLEIAETVLRNPRLAVLALHPHDPDAMGLHISLFDVAIVEAERIEQEYRVQQSILERYRQVARQTGHSLRFMVGGTEELFTQCSQNLFIKQAVDQTRNPGESSFTRWNPTQSLDSLLAHQFESMQVTVSASGLPGASPRNGEFGKIAFAVTDKSDLLLFIPYQPGNMIHGHAAKLWSNPYSSLVISDDHHSLCRVTLSGPSKILRHSLVKKRYVALALSISATAELKGKPLHEPEYWFQLRVAKLIYQREPLAANTLDPTRPTCSISAAGQARHSKKPDYFHADTSSHYQQALQHRREALGRPIDPSGLQRLQWLETVQPELTNRLAHLARLANRHGGAS